MKKLLNWFILAMMAVVVMPMASCDDDDTVVEFTTPTQENVTGSWVRFDKIYKNPEKATIDEENSLYQFITLDLQANGTVVATNSEGEVNGTWSFANGGINLNVGNFNQTCTVKFMGLVLDQMSLSYTTKGTMPNTTNENGEEVEGATVDVNVSVHYTRAVEAVE